MFNFDAFLLHPPLASFPAPLLVLTTGLEVADLFSPRAWLSRASAVCLIVAAAFSGFAFLSGYSASEHSEVLFAVPNHDIALHHTFGRLLLFAVVPCLALHFISRSAVHGIAVFRGLYLFVLALCVGLVVYTGYLGGALVFEHGAGVRAAVVKPN